MFYIFSLLVLLTESLSFEESKLNISTSSPDEFILCRHCGSDISSSDFVVSMKSPVSKHAYYKNLFSKEILIQVLSNDFFIDFPVITVIQSNCVTTGEWEELGSWFPGYRWKFCICPDCGEYIGWYFEPIDPIAVSNKPFYGQILYTLVGESFVDSLMRYPKLGSSN